MNGCAFLDIIDHLVHLIVGELDLLEADDLLGELVPGEGGVRVGIKPVRRGRVTFASHQPAGAVIGVPETRGVISDVRDESGCQPVSLVVTRDDVQQHEVAAPVRNVAEADPHSREHPSGIFWSD